MSIPIGIQSSIWSNRKKTIFLIFLMFFLGLVLSFIIGIFFINKVGFLTEEYFILVSGIYFGIFVIFLIWLLIVIFSNSKIVFGFTNTRELSRKQCPDIYNIVENLCISRGLPMVKIGLINDDSMNAFATGWKKENSYIAFSKGLLKKLNKREIEAVAAHELTHILNEDIKMMLIATTYIGIISVIGNYLFRLGFNSTNRSKNNKPSLGLILMGVVFLIFGSLILPLIKLAISRKREYLADAGSVELTHDKNALISALQKIQSDSTIEGISNKAMSGLFINDPDIHLKYGVDGKPLKRKKSLFGDLFSTHPSIENRILYLQNY